MNLKHIRLLVWKEFLQLRRDPLLLRALFAMPVIQLIFFGYVVAADVTHLSTAVVDLDHSAISRQITGKFEGSRYFDVNYRPAAEADIRALLDTDKIRMAVVIPEGTQAHLDRAETAPLGIIVDGADSQTASIGSGYAAQVIAQFNQDRMSEAGMSPTTGPGVDARVRVMFNPTLQTVNTMIPGLIAAILMISIMVIMSQAVVRERESGTLEQMFVTPVTRNEYLIGKVIPYSLMASIQATIVAVVGVLWFRVPFHGSLLVIIAGLALFMFTCIGMGLFISLLSRTRQQAQQTVMFIMLPTMILSGFIFPIESMPAVIAPVSKVIPLTYALQVLRGAIVMGSGFASLAEPLLALAGFAVVIFGVAVVAMRRRLAE